DFQLDRKHHTIAIMVGCGVTRGEFLGERGEPRIVERFDRLEHVAPGLPPSCGAKRSTNEVADAPSLGDPVLLDERQAVGVGINLEGSSAEPVRACLLPWPRRRVLSKSLNETRRRPQCSQNAERCPAELITELVGNGRDAAAIRTKTDACAADIDAR